MKPTSQLFPLATLVGGLLLGLAIGSLTAPSAAGGTQLADDRPEPASPTDRSAPDLATGPRHPSAAASAAPTAPEPDPSGTQRRSAEGQEGPQRPDAVYHDHLRRILDEGIEIDDPDTWDYAIIGTYLYSDRPVDALEFFLARPSNEGLTELGGYEIAQALEEIGDPRAADALEQTLRNQIEWLADWDEEYVHSDRQAATEMLIDIDPGRAVSVLRELLEQGPGPGEAQARTRLAEALAGAGNQAEALAVVMGLCDERKIDDAGWDLLRQLDPSEMERRLKAVLTEDPEALDRRQELVTLLQEQGRTEESLAHLSALLADGVGTAETRSMLRELDPTRGVAFLEAAVSDSDDPSLWSELGDCRLESDDAEGALQAWMAAFKKQPGNNAWGRRLNEHAPDLYLAELEAQTRRSTDDELWGDLAYAYRQAGRLEEALDCYTQAKALDPEDWSWPDMIADVSKKLDG
jgi:tetratricopeptide (TPR) repeat protein